MLIDPICSLNAPAFFGNIIMLVRIPVSATHISLWIWPQDAPFLSRYGPSSKMEDEMSKMRVAEGCLYEVWSPPSK